LSILDAKLTQDYCEDPGGPDCNLAAGNESFAPNGTRLPITPKVKGNITARYNFPVFQYAGYVQGSTEYVGSRTTDLRTLAAQELGQMPAYAVVDFAAGMTIKNMTAELYVTNAFDRLAVIDRYAECDALTCGPINVYSVPNQPRTIGLRFGQRF
jgi:iron complex outermembrane receptor protein